VVAGNTPRPGDADIAGAVRAEGLWALILLGYECTTKRRPMITAESYSVEELNEQIDAVIAELEALRIEAQKRLAANSN